MKHYHLFPLLGVLVACIVIYGCDDNVTHQPDPMAGALPLVFQGNSYSFPELIGRYERSDVTGIIEVYNNYRDEILTFRNPPELYTGEQNYGYASFGRSHDTEYRLNW